MKIKLNNVHIFSKVVWCLIFNEHLRLSSMVGRESKEHAPKRHVLNIDWTIHVSNLLIVHVQF